MWEKTDIEFNSNGLLCRGWLFKQADDKKLPCVVLAHGLGGVKEQRLDAYAERFASAGYHALVFDYRHFGSSDGNPRQILDIQKQHEDWHSAIRYARSLTFINPDKIILWGSSFSGGHVLQVAVEDEKISAVISQVPHLNGFASSMAAGTVNGVKLLAASIRDQIRRLFNLTPYYVNTMGRPGELAAITNPGEYEASRKLLPSEKEINEQIAARIFMSLSQYSPGKFASRLTAPWLVQIGAMDVTTPVKPAVKAASRAPKSQLIMYQCGHFDVYVQPNFEKVVEDQIEFLKARVQ